MSEPAVIQKCAPLGSDLDFVCQGTPKRVFEQTYRGLIETQFIPLGAIQSASLFRLHARPSGDIWAEA
jgi:hypothetical protein